jgi:two-component system sensor histidine kinase CssS
MKYISNKLGRQLLLLLVIIFDIVLITVGFLIPRSLTSVYDTIAYTTLKNPLEIVGDDIHTTNINEGIVYVYYFENNVYFSNNYDRNIKIDKNELNNYITEEYGKFTHNGITYYYYASMEENSGRKVALANESYFSPVKNQTMATIIILFVASFILIAFITFLWSSMIVRKITKLKNKVDNLDNDNYNHNVEFVLDDEINSLAQSIEEARLSLREEEEYKNSMYQNISHDFKTPIAVIKSYIEAVEDGVEDPNDALKVIKEQSDKLERKVYSLLYLNKLEYLKENINDDLSIISIKPIIEGSIEKIKYRRKDVKIITKIDNSKFFGNEELWETIIDNILNNFVRYANKEIKITVKNNRIVLYNDGESIDEEIVNNLFSPFKKGMKGQFGLGLSIVRKTLNLLNYDISVENNKVGVSFIIKKKVK